MSIFHRTAECFTKSSVDKIDRKLKNKILLKDNTLTPLFWRGYGKVSITEFTRLKQHLLKDPCKITAIIKHEEKLDDELLEIKFMNA